MTKPKKSLYGRYREILGVLARYGYGWALAEINLGGKIPLGDRVRGVAEQDSQHQAERLRLAFEELGPTFIKLGQILSTRADMLTPAYIDELAKLQDAAPPVPYAQIESIIREELEASPQELLSLIHI